MVTKAQNEWLQKEVKFIAGEYFSRLDDKRASELAQKLIRGAIASGEITSMEGEQSEWIQRFSFQHVWLDAADYARALIRAIWLVPQFAGTDFGSSKQRDWGQAWTDTARGFMGEIALARFIEDKFNVKFVLGTRRGDIQDYLPSDIEKLEKPGEGLRKPNKAISVKTTKFNGAWLDLKGKQFEHSDVFVLVKLGISVEHFISFLKDISFIHDKLIPKAKQLDELDDDDVKELWDGLPAFDQIPAYVSGFVEKEAITLPIHSLSLRVRGKKNEKIDITAGVGLFSLSDLRNRDDIKAIDPDLSIPIEISRIGRRITDQIGFWANSGSLEYGKDKWERLLEKL